MQHLLQKINLQNTLEMELSRTFSIDLYPLKNKHLPLIFHSLLELNKLFIKFIWDNQQIIVWKTKSNGEEASPTE